MRTGISIDVSPAIRVRLDAIVADRNSPQKHVWRAQIMLLTADGAGTAEIMRTAGVSKTTVWRWQKVAHRPLRLRLSRAARARNDQRAPVRHCRYFL